MRPFVSFSVSLWGAAAAVTCIAPSASAAFLGFTSFSYLAANGNRVVDIVATTEANGRIMSVFSAHVSGTFIQDSTISNGGFMPDGVHDTRGNTSDSFMCIGAYNGTSQGGQYYGSSRTQNDYWASGWNSASNTVVGYGPGAQWMTPSAAYGDSLAESLSNFAGTRVDSAASAGATHGVWVAHLVMDATQTSLIFDAWVSGYDAGGSGFQRYWGPFQALPASGGGGGGVPLPGAAGLAACGLLGIARRRRR